MKSPTERSRSIDGIRPLTRRQTQCLAYIVNGYTAHAIAQELGISIRMVRAHLESARLRLGAHSTTQAVYLAAKKQWID